MERLKRRKRKRLLRLVLLLCIIVVGLLISKQFIHHPTNAHVVESDSIAPTPTDIPINTPMPNSLALGEAVQVALEGTHGTYAITVQNLKTGEYYGLNDHHVFKSGSLYKLWVMAVVYQQIQAGKLHLTDILNKKLEDLAKEFNITLDPSEPQTTGVLKMTVSDALYQMITISDNNAALLLTDKIHVSSLTQFLHTYGFLESKVGIKGKDPTTTASDIGLFFNKVYTGQLTDQEQTKNMLELLKQQRLNEKLPAELPDNISIAHKTGEIEDYSNDAGIVYAPNGDYIIVVLSQSGDTDAVKGRIANISQAVYNYFNPSTP